MNNPDTTPKPEANQTTSVEGLGEMTCSACPICEEPLWFYDCWEYCPSCNIEIPCSLDDRIEKAKEDEWGLYAFYGRLDELKGRRVKPAQDAKHPNFTEDEHVIVSEIHPPNCVRISYLDGCSVGLRGLSELNLSSLPNPPAARHKIDMALAILTGGEA
jgi:hypothetical protein